MSKRFISRLRAAALAFIAAIFPIAASATVAVVQVASNSASSFGTSLTATFGSTPTTGDTLYACFAYGGNGSASPPSGWTLTANGVNGFVGLSEYTHTQAGGDGAGWTFTQSTNSGGAIGLVDISGAGTEQILSASQGNSTTPSTNTAIPNIGSSLPLGCFAQYSYSTQTIQGGTTSLWNTTNTQNAILGEYGALTSASTNLTATYATSGNWVAGLTFFPSAGQAATCSYATVVPCGHPHD
jgi:hypothetical protein